uniref:Uncharacterized protein n=1 Tax=Tanacetum cinerariifolium TaxID=118510 RepID=A0A699H2T7_TANCI|nr:hypothetical protein [Tanacetum cinerariifolium]
MGPTKERVKIGTTNVRLETTMPQKEETFQVIIDVIKNSTCYKAFTISAEVLEIFMQQFWYTIKKVSGINSYEFYLANKRYLVDAKVFRKILDICPRVKGEDFTKVPDDESTLTFLIDLSYKGPLYNHPNMFFDHMYQPWRTLAATINKYLSNKTASNDRLRRSRIDIIWEIRRVIKKKVSVFADDNIILEPNFALELGKSMRLTKATEEEATRQVHATHERIMTGSDPEPARRRPSGIAFRDTSRVSKKMSPDLSQKLKGVQTLTLEEKLVADIMQALKEKEEKNDDDADKSIDLEKTDDEFMHSEEHVQDDDEETDDEFVHGDEQVNDNEDKEITNAEDADTGNSDEEITDTEKTDAEKTEEVNYDIKKAKLPPSNSSLSLSLGFVLSHIPKIPTISSATTPPSPHPVSNISHVLQQTTTLIPTPPITTEAPLIITIAPVVTTIPDPLCAISQRHQALYDALFNSLFLDDVIRRGQADPEKILRKRDRDDEDPSVGPNQGKKTKKGRTKESKPSKKSSTTKESSKGKSPTKTSKSGKSVIAEEPVEEPDFDMASDDVEQIIYDVVNDVDQPPDDTTQNKEKAPKQSYSSTLSRTNLQAVERHMQKRGDRCPFDLRKPLFLKGRLTVAAEYFINNDMEFLISSYPKKMYTTSITKIKAARYEIVGIEDMVSMLWSATKVRYDKDAKMGIKHWGDKRQLCQETYGHLEEIMVRRADRQLYKFKEGFNNEMSRRKWSAADKRRSELMVELINKKMRERWILKNLERLVGARELEMDYRLMQRISMILSYYVFFCKRSNLLIHLMNI